jgi:hypothetical protein
MLGDGEMIGMYDDLLRIESVYKPHRSPVVFL